MLKPLDLYLLRHGRSEAEEFGVMEYNADFLLTREGQEQARELARQLLIREQIFQALYTSPLLRASQAAIILAEELGLEMLTDERLAEKNIGQIAGMHKENIDQRYPKPLEGFLPHHKMGGGTGESRLAFGFRVHECLWELRERHAGETILLVTHGGVINEALRYLLQTPQHVIFASGDTVLHHLTWGEQIIVQTLNQRLF